MNPEHNPRNTGLVIAADEGQPFWFLNTLTINKVGAADTEGRLSIVDHRMPAGFAPPPHVHQASDEMFLVLDGELDGLCGDRPWQAGPGSLVFLPSAIPHSFRVSQAGPGRIIVIVAPGGFDEFVAQAGTPAADLRMPDPVPPDPARLAELAAAHGIRILPPPDNAA
jgi:mannose-6-phosphate isomerase-like protein (cupin superfamily)